MLQLSRQRKFGSTYVGIFHTKQNSDQPVLEFSTQNKIATYVGIFHRKQNRINLCWTFFYQKKFGSSYIAIVLKKQNSDQPILQFSTQNKIWINLCCKFPHKTKCGSTSIGFFYTKRKKLGSSYIAIVLSEQNSDQPMLQFSTQNKMRINLYWIFLYKKKKIRIKLYCNCPVRTKFGSTYVAIFHTKQNSDQPMLDFSTQKKIRINLCCNFPSKQNSRNVPSYVRTCFSRDS